MGRRKETEMLSSHLQKETEGENTASRGREQQDRKSYHDEKYHIQKRGQKRRETGEKSIPRGDQSQGEIRTRREVWSWLAGRPCPR